MSISIGTMTGHDVVERHSSGLESAAGFGVVDSREEAHAFGHCVAMVPGWTEGVFLDQPTRREDDDYCQPLQGTRVQSAIAVPVYGD